MEPKEIDHCQSYPSRPVQSIPIYQWNRRWLKGNEYSHILNNIDSYCASFGFKKYQYKQHPPWIYQNPSRCIYFVKGKGVGEDLGFPRVGKRKQYRWKKMNFTTDLPKKKPQVTYVVASAMRTQQLQEPENPQYRMHAVVPYAGRNDLGYILCHVREVYPKEGPRLQLHACFLEGHPDFYKLFAFLHSFQIQH